MKNKYLFGVFFLVNLLFAVDSKKSIFSEMFPVLSKDHEITLLLICILDRITMYLPKSKLLKAKAEKIEQKYVEECKKLRTQNLPLNEMMQKISELKALE